MIRRVRIFEKKIWESQNFLKNCVGESGEAFSFLLKASPEIFFKNFDSPEHFFQKKIEKMFRRVRIFEKTFGRVKIF